MKNYKGAAFFDVDGTLVDERLGIFTPTERVKKAIESLKDKGFLIGLATGRARCYVPDTGIDFDCYVSCNGAAAEIGGKEIFNDYIEYTELKKVLDYLAKEGIHYALETPQICYYEKTAQKEIYEMIDVFKIDRNCFIPYEGGEVKINKLLISFKNMEQYDKISRDFAGEYDIMRHHRNLSADIRKKKISKAVGIERVIEYTGVDIKDTYAFGDDFNDTEMLGAVGHGIAMTPHAESLDEVAEYITCGVGGDGIYMGLKHYGLAE